MAFEADVPEDLPPVKGDPERIRQIVENLVDNGYRYTPEGGRVFVRARRTNGEVQVDVVDNGIGIPPVPGCPGKARLSPSRCRFSLSKPRRPSRRARLMEDDDMAKIVIAEDERDIRDLITFTLQFAGHEVIATSNGAEAVEAVKREKPDLVLMDVRMPRMTGYEACRRLKADPETAHIPVVFLSAKGQESEVHSQTVFAR